MTTLLVANDGGHLMQLHTLRPRLGVGDEYLPADDELRGIGSELPVANELPLVPHRLILTRRD